MSAEERRNDFRLWLSTITTNKGTKYKQTTINTLAGGIARLWPLINCEEKRTSPFDYGKEDIDEFERVTAEVRVRGYFTGKDPDMRIGYLRYYAYLKGDIPTSQEVQNDEIAADMELSHELNLILYGPPGTGKTYNTVIKAVEIIDNNKVPTDNSGEINYTETLKRYHELVDQGRIAFTTFHQSYGYEEFIEGIKPVSHGGNIRYEVQSGIFKEFCERAKESMSERQNGSDLFGWEDLIKQNATVWKISVDSAGRKGFDLHDKCLEDNCIRVGWDEDENWSLSTEPGKNSARRFIEEMKIGDIVLSCYSQKEIDAIGVVTGDYEWHEDEPRLKRFRRVKWLKKWMGETKYNIVADNGGNVLVQTTVYRLWRISIDKIKHILGGDLQTSTYEDNIQDNIGDSDNNRNNSFVFVIDEINRGNVSKIFGELITLIEPTKRLGAREEMTCVLPYSGDRFGVPKNIYILGTMNTADRSLVQLDAALRRRFNFEEKMPEPCLLNGKRPAGIDLSKLLTIINERITALLDREHQIGHSYFMHLDNSSTVVDVQRVFKKNVIPLLQEYFFDDYESIQKILGSAFVKEKNNPFNYGKTLYEIVCPDDLSAYKSIYDDRIGESTQG